LFSDVFRDGVEGNIEIRGKTKQTIFLGKYIQAIIY
jgi:hypothetical protein